MHLILSLTPQTRVLIIKHDLLSVLFGTVKDLFSSSVDEKGRLVIKGNSDLTLRILYCVHDLRYAIAHAYLHTYISVMHIITMLHILYIHVHTCIYMACSFSLYIF